jgi:hypothetical protein
LIVWFAEKAHLKSHRVQDNKGKMKNIFTGADVEIHANNGEYYALDFARLMPPSAPNPPNRQTKTNNNDRRKKTLFPSSSFSFLIL